jgi:hypothetical protein
MGMDLKLHQIWYRDEHQSELDPNLLPWDNRENRRPEWCEYWVMRQAAEDFDRHFGDLTGFFSWKFRQKLNIGFSQINSFIQAYPGADCYIFSPAVFQVAFYLNVWRQGEEWHPGITRQAQALLQALGHDINLEKTIDHHLTTAYSNYWIGSRPFWGEYLKFMGGVFNYIESALTDDRHGLWKLVYGSHGGEQHVQFLPIIPFLLERLFSVFVKLHPEFKVTAWQYPLDAMISRAQGAAGLIPMANWCKYMAAETKDEKYLRLFAAIQGEMHKALTEAVSKNKGFKMQ